MDRVVRAAGVVHGLGSRAGALRTGPASLDAGSMAFIVDAQARQSETQDRFEEALDRLSESVRENSALLGRMSERI